MLNHEYLKQYSSTLIKKLALEKCIGNFCDYIFLEISQYFKNLYDFFY